jgi:hypothetical protein
VSKSGGLSLGRLFQSEPVGERRALVRPTIKHLVIVASAAYAGRLCFSSADVPEDLFAFYISAGDNF